MADARPLTVAELIALLRAFPPDAPVRGYTDGDRNGGYFPVERVELDEGGDVLIVGDL